MSFTQEEKFKLLSKVAELDESVKNLIKIIRGEDDSSVPSGLMWDSRKNTEFRKNITRWLWILTALITGVILERIFSLFT